jgi:SAM-dependent methyltransferase
VPDLDRLLQEADRQPFAGWDFSWLDGRITVQPLPWDFEALTSDRASRSPDLLDMGTGGGERLSRLPGRPARTVATESWAPNVPVAGRRLIPLGVGVVHAEGAPDNASQDEAQRTGKLEGRLPFRNGSFQLVTNRHEAFVAAEVARILAPGGRFLTQQIENAWSDDYYRLLGLPAPGAPARPWNLARATAQVTAVGMQIEASGEADECREFLDVGALAWYLKSIPWAIPGFTVDAFRPRLAQLHGQIASDGPLKVRMPHFWLEAHKPR